MHFSDSSEIDLRPGEKIRYVVPNRASFDYSYSVSSIRTNRATVFSYIRQQTRVSTNTAIAATGWSSVYLVTLDPAILKSVQDKGIKQGPKKMHMCLNFYSQP